MPRALSKSKPEPRLVLTGAVLRASALLEITQSSLAQILGLSASTVSRMANGTYTLDDQKKEWELGALFVRLFRSLDAVIGSNDSTRMSCPEVTTDPSQTVPIPFAPRITSATR